MGTVADQYERHLAPVYLWMSGGAEAALRARADEVAALGLPATPGEVVGDLGAWSRSARTRGHDHPPGRDRPARRNPI